MRCDWRIAIENALEDVHVPHVHKESLARLRLKPRWMGRQGKDSMAVYDITDGRSLRGLEQMARHFEVCIPHLYVHVYKFPHTCFSSVGGFTYAHQTYIPDGEITRLSTTLYTGLLKPEAPDLSFFFDRAMAFNVQVFNEDARMCERVHIRGLTGDVPPALRRLAWFTEALNES